MLPTALEALEPQSGSINCAAQKCLSGVLGISNDDFSFVQIKNQEMNSHPNLDIFNALMQSSYLISVMWSHRQILLCIIHIRVKVDIMSRGIIYNEKSIRPRTESSIADPSTAGPVIIYMVRVIPQTTWDGRKAI